MSTPVTSEDRMIVAAVERAAIDRNGPVRVGDVLSMLPRKTVQRLAGRNQKGASTALSRRLSRLSRNGCIADAGYESARHRLYGPPGSGSTGRKSNRPLSHRQRVKDAVRSAAERLGHAVRLDDVVRELDGGGSKVDRNSVSVALAGLARSGDLNIVSTLPGVLGATCPLTSRGYLSRARN